MNLTLNASLSATMLGKPGMPAVAPPEPGVSRRYSQAQCQNGPLAGKLMKELGIASCQIPAHKYKRGSNKHVYIADIAHYLGCSEKTVRRHLRFPEPPLEENSNACPSPLIPYIDMRLPTTRSTPWLSQWSQFQGL